MTGHEALASLVQTLEEIPDLLPAEKADWDSSRLARLAVERLWIQAGNAAEEFRRAAGIEPGVEPWAELAAYRHRIAHALPGDLSSDRVWADSVTDLPRLLKEVRHHQG